MSSVGLGWRIGPVCVVAAWVAASASGAPPATAAGPGASAPASRPIGEAHLALANEIVLFDGNDERRGHFVENLILACDGNRVLYDRLEEDIPPEGGPPRSPSLHRLVLYDVPSRQRRAAPLPAIFSSNPVEYDNLFRLRVVSPDGRRILLPSGVDSNQDGVFDHKAEPPLYVCYDMAADKVQPLDVDPNGGLFMIVQYDAKGDGLVVIRYDPVTFAVTNWLQPLVGGKGRALATKGGVFSIAPVDDLAVVLHYEGKPPAEPHTVQRLELYDLKADKPLPGPPASDRYAETMQKRVQWTSDGRFLYFTDVPDDRNAPGQRRGPEMVCRVWDRKTGQDVAKIADFLPLAPAADGRRMLLFKREMDGHKERLALHDPATGALWELAESFSRIHDVRGKWIAYSRREGNRPAVFYRAEIVLPGAP